jgi:hypothetical protein
LNTAIASDITENTGFDFRDLSGKIIWAFAGILIVLQSITVIITMSNNKKNQDV